MNKLFVVCKNLLLCSLIYLILLCACGTIHIGKPRSICDTQTDSLICDTAKRFNIRLETAANIIMMANFANVDKGTYTAEQSVDFLYRLRDLINMKPSAAIICSFVRSAFKNMPLTSISGVMIISPHIDYFDIDRPITDNDVVMLNDWINAQIDILSE